VLDVGDAADAVVSVERVAHLGGAGQVAVAGNRAHLAARRPRLVEAQRRRAVRELAARQLAEAVVDGGGDAAGAVLHPRAVARGSGSSAFTMPPGPRPACS